MNLFASSQADLIILILFITLCSAIVAMSFYFLRQTQRHNTQLIGTMRDSYEKQLYTMNNNLSASMDRWKDVNHLLLGSEAVPLSASKDSSVQYSSFLKANGIQSDEIEPDPELVFVLTPFNNLYDEVFKVIRTTCMDIGLKCYRGDEHFIKGEILPHILKLLCKATVVIANIEGRNPNVFYELGLAHAMDKNTLLLTKTVESLPIDVKTKKIIVYQNIRELQSMLKDELLKLAYQQKNIYSAHMKTDSTIINEQHLFPMSVVINGTSYFKKQGMSGYLLYEPDMTVDRFLDSVYSFFLRRGGDIRAHTYGNKWLLMDSDLGRVFHNIGYDYSKSYDHNTDERPIKSVGIDAGMVLEVIKP